MIAARGLTKRYGSTLAVDGLSFDVREGRVTGFLGPNGSGKSTTLRMVIGLDAPTQGTVTINGQPYASLRRPLFEVGAMLEATAIHDTSEYGSGMIRTTLAAVPQRLAVLAAKATAFSAVTLVVATTACFIAFFVGQAILSTKDIGVGLGDPNALRTVVGTGLYLGVLGLLALGVGTLIRKTAGAITAMFGVIFVLPVVAALLPSSMSAVQRYLPTSAGEAIITGGSDAAGGNSLSPWVGLGVFFLYAVAALAAAAFTLVRRDA